MGGAERTSRLLLLGLRVLLSALLVLLILRHVDLARLPEILSTMRLPWLLLMLVAAASVQLVNALRWLVALRIPFSSAVLGELLIVQLRAAFVGAFLPGEFGGDVVRGIELVGRGRPKGAVAASLLLLRGTGLAVSLSVIACLGLALRYGGPAFVAGGTSSAWGVLALIVLSSLFFLVAARWLPEPERGAAKGPFGRLCALALETAHSLRDFARSPLPFLLFLLLTFLSVGLMILEACALGSALGLETMSFAFVFGTRIVSLVGFLPLGVGGIGVKEGAFLVVLEGLGFEKAPVLALALMNRATRLLFVAFGGGLWLWCPPRSQGDSESATAPR